MPLVSSNVSNTSSAIVPNRVSVTFGKTIIPFGVFQNFTVCQALDFELGKQIYTAVYYSLRPKHWHSKVFFLWSWRVHERALVLGAHKPFDYIYRRDEYAPAFYEGPNSNPLY